MGVKNWSECPNSGRPESGLPYNWVGHLLAFPANAPRAAEFS